MPEQLDDLDQRLRGALPPVAAPADFAERVASLAVRQSETETTPATNGDTGWRAGWRIWQRRWVVGAAVLAGVALAIVHSQRVSERQMAGAIATQQLQFAVALTQNEIQSITNRALAHATRSLSHD